MTYLLCCQGLYAYLDHGVCELRGALFGFLFFARLRIALVRTCSTCHTDMLKMLHSTCCHVAVRDVWCVMRACVGHLSGTHLLFVQGCHFLGTLLVRCLVACKHAVKRRLLLVHSLPLVRAHAVYVLQRLCQPPAAAIKHRYTCHVLAN